MLACDCCLEIFRPSCDATVDRLGSSNHVDPVWIQIRSDALIEIEREPILRDWIQRSVLCHASLEESLSVILVEKLFASEANHADYQSLFREITEDAPGIAIAAKDDLLAIQKRDPATDNLLNPLLNFKGFLALQAHRIANVLWQNGRRSLAHRIQHRASKVFGVDIHPAATVGSGVFIDHGTGVVIGETAVVGDDVTILHGVTLGGTGKHGGDRHPKLGNGVFVGASAQLLGNIWVGDEAKIGAGSVVLKDVDARTTVAGVPAQVVRRAIPPRIPFRGVS